MPRSESTLLNFLNSNDHDSKEIVPKILDFFDLKYPDLELCIIQHIYAPECYKSGFAEDCGRKYVERLLNKNDKPFSRIGDFYMTDGMLISPSYRS